MPAIALEGVSKRFGRIRAVEGLDAQILDGEYVTILAPTGSGKTTTLRLVAGLLRPDEGRILFDGEDVTGIPPEARGLGFLPQIYALFPHMTVWDNVAFGPVIRGWGEEGAKVARQMLEMVHLSQRPWAYPAELSGGMQQRVALARALACGAKTLLLDEPLSALDARLRVELRDELRRLAEALGLTVIHVTHDQEEAMAISDRVIVLRRGRVEQAGPPLEIYLHPRTLFVANFVGEVNLLEGVVQTVGNGLATLAHRSGRTITALDQGFEPGERGVIAVRPERVMVEAEPQGFENVLWGVLEEKRAVGPRLRLTVSLEDGARLVSHCLTPASPVALNPGERVAACFHGHDAQGFRYPAGGLAAELE